LETNEHTQATMKKWCKGDDIQDCTHKQRYDAKYQSQISSVLGAILLRQVGAR